MQQHATDMEVIPQQKGFQKYNFKDPDFQTNVFIENKQKKEKLNINKHEI